MTVLFQQLVNGFSLGATYAVFAIGFTMIFGVLNLLNMAHGAVFMWGAYIGLACVADLGLPLALAVPAAFVFSGLLSVSYEIVIFGPLRKKEAHRWIGLIASLAMARGLVALAQMIFGTHVVRYPTVGLLSGYMEMGGVRVHTLQIVIFGIAVLLMGALAFMLQRTRMGRAIRTVAFSPRVAELAGISVRNTAFATFFLAGALAGVAGVLLGLLFNAVSPFMGETILLKGLTVVILGGLGSVPGAMLGGLLLGVIEVFSVGYVSSAFRDAIGFGLVFVILLIKPSGLFGQTEAARA
ncbi:MAG: branched-chain amino acid ABC transporter permease [Desulfovibrio sp.]|jgi:branched-chain amino acid transport system permease protein|nr:branched-chain amino acid ABC transporter permease [Desulfovibrio sp.]